MTTGCRRAARNAVSADRIAVVNESKNASDVSAGDAVESSAGAGLAAGEDDAEPTATGRAVEDEAPQSNTNPSRPITSRAQPRTSTTAARLRIPSPTVHPARRRHGHHSTRLDCTGDARV